MFAVMYFLTFESDGLINTIIEDLRSIEVCGAIDTVTRDLVTAVEKVGVLSIVSGSKFGQEDSFMDWCRGFDLDWGNLKIKNGKFLL